MGVQPGLVGACGEWLVGAGGVEGGTSVPVMSRK